MAGGKLISKTKQVEWSERERQVWDLRVKGWDHQRIADHLGVERSTVTKCLRRASDKHHTEFMQDIHDYKKQQAKIIEAVAYNALEQYYESQKPQVVTTQTGNMKDKKFVGNPVVSIQTAKKNADSKLLLAFYKGMEEVRKIWGMENVQEKSNDKTLQSLTVEDKVALFTSIPIEERLKLLDSMITSRPQYNDELEQPDPKNN